jgi:preprotein translocase subunit SecG
MAFIIGLLTVVLVLDCLLLVLLVLIQLPKKEAGAGVAFGGAATDALFGAGSGNVLTKTTKYCAALFFILAVLVGVLQNHLFHRSSAEFRQELKQEQQQPTPSQPAPAPSTPTPPAAASGATTGLNLLTPGVSATNAPPAAIPPK